VSKYNCHLWLPEACVLCVCMYAPLSLVLTSHVIAALYDASRGKKMITKAEFAEMLTKW